MQLNVVLTLIFAIVIATFAIFNASVVTVSFFFTEVQLSLAIVIILSALIGALVIWFFDAFKKIKSAKQIKELNKKITVLDKQFTDKAQVVKELEEKLEFKEQLIAEMKENEKLRALEVSSEKKTENTIIENGE